MQRKTGGPAFPQMAHDYTDGDSVIATTDPQRPGMTLRQYYKAKIAAGMMANSFSDERAGCWALTVGNAEFARHCGELADALLAEDSEFEAKQQGGGE